MCVFLALCENRWKRIWTTKESHRTLWNQLKLASWRTAPLSSCTRLPTETFIPLNRKGCFLCVCVCLDSLPFAHLLRIKRVASGMRSPSAAAAAGVSDLHLKSQSYWNKPTVWLWSFCESEEKHSTFRSPSLKSIQTKWLNEKKNTEICQNMDLLCVKMKF